MRRQAATLLVSALLTLIFAVVADKLPVPYVREIPGPVSDTLGVTKGKALITVKGAPTSPTTGRIYLLTVLEYGGPGQNISGGSVILGWWRTSEAVVPRRVLFPPTETAQSAAQQDANDMTESQEEAKVAALRYLGYKLQPGVDVAQIEPTSTAKGALKVDDVIVGVDGKAVTDSASLVAITKSHKIGDKITLNVNRNGTTFDVPVTLQKPPADRTDQTTPTIGVQVVDSFAKPFEIDIDLKNVGGPSAGMAFALGIIDKLSGGNLTGGKTIAGTGTIDASGNVGPIGGVVQKMAAARRAGAGVFLIPNGNCADAKGSVPHGLRLVAVTTLSGAVDALKQIRDGGSNVPSCPKS
jgi:Lon-like protease